MHYIRFLKPPYLSQPPKGSKDVYLATKITISNDLGESFLCVDLSLVVVLLDGKGLPTQSHVVNWKAGNRQLEISFSVPRGAHPTKGNCKWPVRVHVQPLAAQNRLEKLAHLLKGSIDDEEPQPFVFPVSSEPINDSGAPATPRMSQRMLKTADGESLYIWEETGESIARHVWDAGLVLSAYLDALCHGNTHSSVTPLSSLQKVLSKEQLHVLELGTGCGIVGLTLGKSLPKTKVILTDLPEAEEIAKHNIWVNGMQPKSIHRERARIQYQKLGWEDPLPDKQRKGDIDLVLIADCTYNPDVVPFLVKTLAELLRYNKEIIIMLGMKVRHDSERIFFDLMAKKHLIIVDRLVLPLPLFGQDSEEIEIYVFAGNSKQDG